ncbi:N-acetylgalactosamine-N,N'-diacetylbacillosaminyl-diphospho-undecaprenol 4-alpha-N-acetylgalactosaminyltransferase [Thiorhodovibrio winogradskyi]|uniref:N-acetylgalactosamine-N, N'-diacetylbacillosaminyl-diphospho-undecaprenol 4-alpha-N-acetylgalactosaminyltransferase n=1 Tax=Thiorhodovibrio winogradskyi TaxID=77007 RepID=A0ABZ0S6V3_9GAMM|nr:glycosyltransferase [Thiorhodovibrio winogradskyi]
MSPHPDSIAVLASFSGNGGVERMLINLLIAFDARGIRVDLLLLRANSAYLRDLPPGIRQRRLAGRHSQLAIPALALYLRRARPAALLVAKDRAGRSAVMARALAGVDTAILLRLGTHLSTAMAARSAAERWLRYGLIRWLYPHIEGIVAVSAGVAEDVRTLARLPAERIHVVRNPVITPALAERAQAPCPHPWLRHAEREPAQTPVIPVILGIGRLQRQKDFPTLIRAFAQLRQQRPCRLIILGEGAKRPELEGLIAELGLSESVDLPGFLANPYPFIARANLLALSSAWEGSPNALTEALALGTPAVATDCPSGPAEILRQGRFGPLVPVGDAHALAQAMAATLDAPLPAETLRAAVSDYQADISAGRYLELIQRIRGQSSSRR